MLSEAIAPTRPVNGLYEGLNGNLRPAVVLGRKPNGRILLRVTYPDGEYEMETFPFRFVRRAGCRGCFILVAAIETDEYVVPETPA